MSIKLQLDANAINAVLSASGEETKIQLQQSIVNEFAKKYLKGVIAQNEIVGIEKSIREYISEQFGSQKSRYTSEINLNEQTKKSIHTHMQTEFDRFVRGAIKEIPNYEEMINTAIQKAFANIDFDNFINKVYQKEFDAIVKEKIQAKIREMLKSVDLSSFIK